MNYVQDYAEVFANRLQPDRPSLKMPAGRRGSLIESSGCRIDHIAQDATYGHEIGVGGCSTAENQAKRRKQIARVVGFYSALLLISGVVAVVVDPIAVLKRFAGLSARSAAVAPGLN